MYKIYYKSKTDNKVKKSGQLQKGCWIHLENPDDQELQRLTNELDLDYGHLMDALDPYEVPRFEEEDGKRYFFLRFASMLEDKIATIPLLVVIGDDFFLTVCKHSVPVLEKLLESKDFCTTQKTKLFIQLLLLVNHDFKKYTNTIIRGVKNLSINIEQIGNKEIVAFVEFERTLEDLLTSLVPTNLTIENILHGKILRLYEEDQDLIEDVSLSNNQLIELSKATLKNIVNTREAYSTIMTNNLNRTMKFLTSITIIMTIPTMISSFYGMNVALPMQTSPFTYLWILFITIIVSAVLLYVFFKNKLL